MGNHQSEKEYEEIRITQTIALARAQLKQAEENAARKKSEKNRNNSWLAGRLSDRKRSSCFDGC